MGTWKTITAVKRLCVATSLAGLATISHAAAIFGLQTVPAWNERSDLTVEVTNWSKLEFQVDSLAVTLSGGGGRPCQWAVTPAFALGPTDKRAVLVADRSAVQACLRGRNPAVALDTKSLHFVAVVPDKEGGPDKEAAHRPTELVLRVEVHVSRSGRTLETSSAWLLEQGQR
ncbi:hypothetical protein [Pyxidicoccus caerfyrddinensis]|uniref:hypothetical protein n=1 Tax=Pyxidicoccus caerfyrddinensis TaxID=2709663 RepID=UPI0013D97C23|nr:hypothetical protein [Pyxidicoccus caerfyrddinensis]